MAKRKSTPAPEDFNIGDYVVYCGPGRPRHVRAEGLIEAIEGAWVRFDGFIAHRDFVKLAALPDVVPTKRGHHA